MLTTGLTKPSPLGMFAPHFKGLAEQMQSLIADLDTHAPSNGFLGGNTWMNSSDRTTSSEVMTLVYFKTHADLQAFAHGKHHREVWDWWYGLAGENKVGHLSIAHEVYCSRKGEWEGVYVNMAPSMFAATSHWVLDKEGEGKWVSPIVKGNGRFRSALGRMGKSLGDDNEKYGDEPYEV
jgi:heme-degrading monooxygenase HmoA